MSIFYSIRSVSGFLGLSCILAMGSLFLPVKAVAAELSPITGVAELFTSQACPFSPEGDKNLSDLATEKGVLALTYPVTYLNYTGWKDRNARPEHDARQSFYVNLLPDLWRFTPQLVVNGRMAVSARKVTEIQSALKASSLQSMAKFSALRRTDGVVQITVPELAVGVQLLLITYEANPAPTTVTAGKNRGKKLSHTNVVRGIQLIENNASGVIHRSEAIQKFECALLVQDITTGTITAATGCAE